MRILLTESEHGVEATKVPTPRSRGPLVRGRAWVTMAP
jgi:hypothetical protein